MVGEKVSHRLAQEPGRYKVLKYVRHVIKRRDTGDVLTPSAPANVLERAAVDVSFLAGMLVDKFTELRAEIKSIGTRQFAMMWGVIVMIALSNVT